MALDCDTSSMYYTYDGGSMSKSVTYCIDSIEENDDGTFYVDMSCDHEGDGMGDGDNNVSIYVNGELSKEIKRKDCGWGFEGGFNIEASPGDDIEVKIEYPHFNEPTWSLSASFPEPESEILSEVSKFVSNGIEVENGSVIGGDLSAVVSIENDPVSLGGVESGAVATMKEGDKVYDTKEITLEPGETREVELNTTIKEDGDHKICVDVS